MDLMNESRLQTAATSDAVMLTEGETSWLDRSVLSMVRINWETVAWVLLFTVAAVARFYDLGVRAMSHDESLHSLYAFYLYDKGNYEHNPMMHGPFRYHITALFYFLFGDSDTTARLAPALMGLGVLGMVYLYRRYIGRLGALAAGVMVAISPSLLFHSRYIRDDIFISFFTAVWVYGAMRYLDEQSSKRYRWLMVMVVSMGLAFTTMENAFIHGALFGIFFSGLALWQIVKGRLFIAVSPALFGVGIGFWFFETGQTIVGLICAVVGVLGMLVLLGMWLGAEGWRKLRSNESAVLAVLMATLVLPFLSPVLHLALGWDAMAYASNTDLLRSGGLILVMTVIAVAIAFYWFGMRPQADSTDGAADGTPPERADERAYGSLMLPFVGWAQLMGAFWLIQVLFFTTFLTNTRNGLATGIVGSLGYWLAQHEVQRGNQPPYYYLMLGSLYEFLPMILSIGAVSATLYWLRRRVDWDPVPREDLPVELAATEPERFDLLRRNRTYFVILVIWWMFGTWIGYTAAGEKMPWLLTHMALPMCVLGGWWFGYFVRKIPWVESRQQGSLWLMGVPVALIFLVALLISNSPFQGRDVDALAGTMQWLLALAALVGVGYALWVGVRRVGRGAAARICGLGFVAILLALTVRFTYMLNYINYDMATEYLVYAHATPDIKRLLSELDLISERTVGERNVVVAYDDDTSWPLSWYMRLYPNSRFYGSSPNADVMSAPVVIVGPKNYEAVRPYVTRDYVKRTYRLVWWPDQGYFDLTWDRFMSTITDAEKMKRIFQIVLFRRYADNEDPTKPRDLTKWPNRHEFEMYVRRDIAEQIWNLNVTPVESISNAQEELLRQRAVDLTSVSVVGGVQGGAPLLTPRVAAISPTGDRVIADTGNHRVLVVDANGQLVQEFGSLCRVAEGAASGCVDPDGSGPLDLGDGQFQEPWGIAVDAEGMIFVADTWNGRIQVFDSAGKFVHKWGIFNTTNGTLGDPLSLFGPRGIAIDSSGYLLVADTGNKRILQFTPTGEFVNQIGGGGVRLGNFEEPTSVGVDPRDGSVYVADAWNRRIQKFDANLQPLAEWPVPSWGSQHLYHKPYVTVAGNGDVYASDPENFRVLVYNSAGGVKATFGSYGTEMNRFGLPNGVAWNGQNNTVLVVDADNQRVMDFPAVP
jgi:uncharacterized protein (TIGR03663 family)